MRLTSRLNDFAGYLIVVVAVVLTLAMVVFGILPDWLRSGPAVHLRQLQRPTARGSRSLQRRTTSSWLFALGLLLPAYTLTGFDASAQTSEETHNPTHAVPRGIIRAVLISGIAGWIVLSAVVLAAPDMERAAQQGDQCFYCIIGDVVPELVAAAAIVHRHRGGPVSVRPGRGHVGVAHGLRILP